MASGPKGETTDMAAVPEAARRVRAEACRELVGIYLPNRPDLASALEQVLAFVERYLKLRLLRAWLIRLLAFLLSLLAISVTSAQTPTPQPAAP
jgi:hypothetical protein